GKLYTSIEALTEFNNLCTIPNSGLFFLANENTKIQTYYIPSLGPAPRWASFLDSLTEELEESNTENVYDDYKFITKQELENLGLEHLIGTKLLRAYMHGYFMDIRLYKKAKSVADPFDFEEYRKKKIRETIEKDRTNRVQIKTLPKVNKDLALKLMDNQINNKKKKEGSASLLNDNRFKDLFENPDFEIVLRKKELRKKLITQEFEPVEEELEGKNSSEESSDESETEESSDDEHNWTQEVKKQHRIIQREHRQREWRENLEAEMKKEMENKNQPKLFELRQGEEFKGIHNFKRTQNKATLGERLETEDTSVRLLGSVGKREMTFSTRKKRDRMLEERNKKHREERKKLIRSTHGINSKHKSKFFSSKRK
ncbi:hypothetical protein NQ314_005365, partial [Rhamnusium bicolor]